MKKHAYLIFTLLIMQFSFSQINDRIAVSGVVEVPVGEDPQGISIYNITSKEGTITNAAGAFSLGVALSDTLKVYAVQFEEFSIVIDDRILKTKKLNIYVTELMNRLPEVVVSPYDLTGVLATDAESLQVINTASVFSEIKGVEGYVYTGNNPEFGQAPKNEALALSQNRLVNGLNFVNLFKLLLISNKQNDIANPYSEGDVDINTELRQLYNDQFFKSNFNIDYDNISDFILYADVNGLDEEMLKKGNELDLIEFLMGLSKKYKKQLERN